MTSGISRPSNSQIAEMLREIGEHLAMQNVPFKPRAYEKAALIIDGLEEEAADMYASGGMKALQQIPGVGISIAEKIEEMIKTGRVRYFEILKKKTPVDLSELSRVEGLGPKGIKRLYEELGISNLAELEKAAKAGKIAKLDGFGRKSEEKILKSIGFAKTTTERFILGLVAPRVKEIEESLARVPGVTRATIAGSARRRRETIGDADILVVSSKPDAAMDFFVSMPDVVSVIARGETKSSVKLKMGMNVDVRVVPAESYGAALNYFTGSKDHNVALRKIAVAKGWKLNEYGLFDVSGRGADSGSRRRGAKGERLIAGASEEEVYGAFGMDYIEPELRENTGELEAALAHKLPKLIGYGDLQGDLQVQTSWTDGGDSIETMARAAMKQGLKYMVVTDHTKRLAMTHGLDEKRIMAQGAEIDKINKKMDAKFTILKGTECDILKDGSMDLPDEILKKLDVVGASVHSFFNLTRAEQTVRVKRAMSNQHVDILFHPTGRILNRRDAYDIDMDDIIAHAKSTGTVLEIDAYPDRSDMKDEYIRKCVDAGVKMSIDSDAHSFTHFPFLECGIAQARRGWASKRDIINAWPVKEMKKFLKK